MQMAELWYKHGTDQEKRDMVALVFTELVFEAAELASFTAKEGFQALFKRRDFLNGGPQLGIAELTTVYLSIDAALQAIMNNKSCKRITHNTKRQRHCTTNETNRQRSVPGAAIEHKTGPGGDRPRITPDLKFPNPRL